MTTAQHSALDSIREAIAPELTQLNEHMLAALGSSNTLMNSVIESYLDAKGKQIRPILVILSAKLFSPQPPVSHNTILTAAAVEMLHNATLIHDDVVDQSQLRHGNSTINSVWDNHIAVLIGDFFVSNALRQAVDTSDIRIVAKLASLGRLLSEGEMDQICNARFHLLTEESYFRVIAHKTASLFEACVEVGAYSVGATADDPRVTALCAFAQSLGLCFQIKDDIFDYFDQGHLGKPTGNDLREGKVTLPLLHALSLTDNPAHEAMTTLSQKEELTTDDITTLIDYSKQAGGIDYAYATMQRLQQDALAQIASLPDSPEKKAFIDLLDFIITRDN